MFYISLLFLLHYCLHLTDKWSDAKEETNGDQLNEEEGHEGQGEGHSVNRQLQYFGTTRSPKRRPPYPPRPSLKQKKQVKTEGLGSLSL